MNTIDHIQTEALDGPTHSGLEATALVRGNLELMGHIRCIADQLHEHGLLLQLIDGVFIVRDSEWVRENFRVDAVQASEENE